MIALLPRGPKFLCDPFEQLYGPKLDEVDTLSHATTTMIELYVYRPYGIIKLPYLHYLLELRLMTAFLILRICD
jgi:hypothetical protein